MPRDVVPPTIRQGVVAVQVRHTSIPRTIVQVAKSQPQKPTNAAQRPMLNPFVYSYYILFGASLRLLKEALPAFQAGRSMPLLPLQESRATKAHPPVDKGELPKHDRPAIPEPLYKPPKASHSLVPVVVPVPFS